MPANSRNFVFSILFLCAVFCAGKAKGQAKSSIGIGAALNTSKENSQGFGAFLQGEIKLAKSVSIVPSVGGEVAYGVYAGLAGRYYFTPAIYVSAGSFANYNGESGSGAGATGGIGFILMSNHRQTIDLNFHGDYIKNKYQTIPVAGVRFIYSFSFTRLN
jgi:hypothetical protein